MLLFLVVVMLLSWNSASAGECYTLVDSLDPENIYEQEQSQNCLRDFYLGKFEVTQGEWKAVMGNNPSYFQIRRTDDPDRCILCGIKLCAGCPDVETSDMFPVENVSWDDVQEFILKLNQRTGKKYRLPTALEWEYAASAGGKKERWAGTDFESDLWQFAWYGDTSGYRTSPVGQKVPNTFGFHDMTGNVWEWVNDSFPSDYYKIDFKRQRDRLFPGMPRMLKGGSWYDPPLFAVISVNEGMHPTTRSNSVGFRLAFSAETDTGEHVDPATGMRFIFVKGQEPPPKPKVEQPPKPEPPSLSPPRQRIATLDPVYFDLDEHNIRPDAAETLKKNVEWFQQNPGRKVRIEGNADERAGRPYNMALGKKRANAVKQSLIELGVDAGLLETATFGKERPVCSERIEECYWRNRRVDLVPIP
jgi:peptidoglycan-associated lipoprotein